jgi:iron-sulfur cluster assembly protein
MALKISDAAVTQLKEQRVSYALEFDDELGPEDRVVCDKKSDLYLNYVQQGLTGGFTFVNPNVKSSCGCGSSFSV